MQLYYEPDSLGIGDCKRRLLRKHQILKRLRLLKPEHSNTDIYEVLFSIDYNVDNARGKFISDQSFTYVQWMMSSEKGDLSITSANSKKIDTEKLVILCLAIMPGCRTLLHLLATKSQEL